MEFADYFSRNPTIEAIPPPDEDMKFTFNSLEKLKLFLLRNELIRNGATSATDHNTEAKQVTNDVINPTRIYSKTNYASCLNKLTFQSDKGSHSINSTSELHFSIGDKTTKIIYNKKNIARKSIAETATEPRITLAS